MKVYDESGCFDPNPMTDYQPLMGGVPPPPPGPGATSTLELEDNLNLSSFNHHHHEDVSASASTMHMEIQQHYVLDTNTTTTNTPLIPQLTKELSYEQSNWDADQQSFSMLPSSSSPETAYPPTPDLLNLFHLPRCSFLPSSSISFENTPLSPVVYDPLFHLNLHPQPPVFRELLQSLPHGYTLPPDHDTEETAGGRLYHDGDNGILEFTRDISMPAHAKSRGRGTAAKTTKHFATERERRVHLNDRFQALRNMVPNPTKVY